MVYISGAPVMFVGCGQSYTDLKKLNVKSIVKTLLNWWSVLCSLLRSFLPLWCGFPLPFNVFISCYNSFCPLNDLTALYLWHWRLSNQVLEILSTSHYFLVCGDQPGHILVLALNLDVNYISVLVHENLENKAIKSYNFLLFFKISIFF